MAANGIFCYICTAGAGYGKVYRHIYYRRFSADCSGERGVHLFGRQLLYAYPGGRAQPYPDGAARSA